MYSPAQNCWTYSDSNVFGSSMASSSSSAGTEEVEKHILRKYEICQKLGKGVRIRLPARAFAVQLLLLAPPHLAH